MNIWIEGARPKTLIASLSPVLIGSVIALEKGNFHLLTFFLTVLFALAIQIGTNFTNDYFDFFKGADTEKRKGPRRLTQSGLVSPKKMKKITFWIFSFAALCAFYLTFQGGWVIGCLALVSILFGYLYTGGPYPLSYLGIADFFVFIFFGPIAVAGTTYLQTHQLSLVPILVGCAPGLISTAILTSNNLRDVNEDRTAHKKTLIVRFGLTFGCFEYAFCLIIASCTPLIIVWLTGAHYGCLVAMFSFLFAIPLIKISYHLENIGSLLPKTGKWMMLYTLAFIVGWLL